MLWTFCFVLTFFVSLFDCFAFCFGSLGFGGVGGGFLSDREYELGE